MKKAYKICLALNKIKILKSKYISSLSQFCTGLCIILIDKILQPDMSLKSYILISLVSDLIWKMSIFYPKL